MDEELRLRMEMAGLGKASKKENGLQITSPYWQESRRKKERNEKFKGKLSEKQQSLISSPKNTSRSQADRRNSSDE